MDVNNNSFIRITNNNNDDQVKPKPVRVDLKDPVIKISTKDSFTLKTSQDSNNAQPIKFVDEDKISSKYDDKTQTATINTQIGSIKADSVYDDKNKKLKFDLGTGKEEQGLKFKTKLDTANSAVELIGVENKTGNKTINADFDPKTQKGSASIVTDEDKFKLDTSYDFIENKFKNIGGGLKFDKGSLNSTFDNDKKLFQTELSNSDGKVKLSGSYDTVNSSFKNAKLELKEGDLSLSTSFEQPEPTLDKSQLKVGLGKGDTKLVGNFQNTPEKSALNSIEFSTEIKLGETLPATGLDVEYDNQTEQFKKAGVKTSFDLTKETKVSLGANLVPNSFEQTAKIEHKVSENTKLGLETKYD
ncbi:MAG: hypothetical protein ACK4IX_03225, partial [Candidatus Sericytochromatia bacterium]